MWQCEFEKRYIVECRYSRDRSPEVIAVFDRKIDAERYAAQHDNEGGCSLRVDEVDEMAHLEYEIQIFYEQPHRKYNYIDPFGASFKYECEALSFAHRHALWNGGYSVVVQQPLSEAVS